MNLAQQLLKEQFPAINGLQSTLLQSKKGIGTASTEQFQIIHSRGDHWIVASTVGSKGDKVQVFDPVYSTLDKATLDVIANLFHSSTVKMMECQKQEGGKDCGLYAIAYATTIAHGFGVKINQSENASNKELCTSPANLKVPCHHKLCTCIFTTLALKMSNVMYLKYYD